MRVISPGLRNNSSSQNKIATNVPDQMAEVITLDWLYYDKRKDILKRPFVGHSTQIYSLWARMRNIHFVKSFQTSLKLLSFTFNNLLYRVTGKYVHPLHSMNDKKVEGCRLEYYGVDILFRHPVLHLDEEYKISKTTARLSNQNRLSVKETMCQ